MDKGNDRPPGTFQVVMCHSTSEDGKPVLLEYYVNSINIGETHVYIEHHDGCIGVYPWTSILYLEIEKEELNRAEDGCDVNIGYT
jgi:hypothetical protein